MNCARLILPICALLMTYAASAQPEIHINSNIIYGHVDSVALMMDVAKPPTSEGPFPAIVCFHGGGWQQGNKSHMHRWLRRFASSGYVAVTVAYRFAPRFKWPSQVEDAKAAVRYLRANAKIFNVDPDHIGVMGESAGGYLALMLGMTDPKDNLEGNGGSPDVSSRVQAVVSFFSAADFTLPRRALTPELQKHIQEYYGKSLPEVLADFTGASDHNDPILKKISVLPYVDKNDPPVMLFQGDADPFVSIEQAHNLADVLKKNHVRHQLIIVKGGGHGFTGTQLEETTVQMLEFFDKILKRR
jgi:acetyl esterase/lipase